MPIINLVYEAPREWKPSSSTLLYLPFTEDLNDYSWNNNNPTSSTNASITTLNWVKCCYLNIWRIVLPDIWSVFNSTFTVSWYINITGTVNNWYDMILWAWWGGSYNAFGFSWYYKPGRNDFWAWFYAWAEAKIDTTGYSWWWRNFTATFDANKKLTLYQNWVEVASATASTPHISNNTLYVWVNTEVPNNSSWYSYCYLWNIILENRAWSADEISTYYNWTKANYGL